MAMGLNEKILELRKAHGMTQDELAQALFVTRQSVYKWETGRSVPDVEKVRQLCRLFHVSADELLELAEPGDAAEPAPSCQEADGTPGETDIPTKKATPKIRRLLLVAFLALAILAAGVLAHRPSAEIQEAVKLGIVPSGLQRHLGATVSEKDFLCMLQNASQLQLDGEVPMLAAAAESATNEQLTREKAAYWLYCTHIWTKIDPDADLSIGTHAVFDPITQRDFYQDLNSISRPDLDSFQQPWEWSLCKELKAVDELFRAYDGTREMDSQINAILYGPYYTAVTFCAAQKSFLSEKPLMECTEDSFRPKDKLTRKEAIIAAYRLYGSW